MFLWGKQETLHNFWEGHVSVNRNTHARMHSHTLTHLNARAHTHTLEVIPPPANL